MRRSDCRPMRCARIIAALILSSFLNPPLAWAQATGQINGSVTDSSGALLPGVTVTVTQTVARWPLSTVRRSQPAATEPRARLMDLHLRANHAATVVTVDREDPALGPVLVVGVLDEDLDGLG